MNIKTYSGYIILNWKTGEKKLRTYLPRPLSPYEVAVKFSIRIIYPELNIPVLALDDIRVPEARIEGAEGEEVGK